MSKKRNPDPCRDPELCPLWDNCTHGLCFPGDTHGVRVIVVRRCFDIPAELLVLLKLHAEDQDMSPSEAISDLLRYALSD